MSKVLNDLVWDGKMPGLKALVESGYTSMGWNYGCGCLWSGWYKEGKLVYEHRERCYEHKLEGGPLTEVRKTSDLHDGTSKIWEEHAESKTQQGAVSPDSIQG